MVCMECHTCQYGSPWGYQEWALLCDWTEPWSFHGVSLSSFSINVDGHLGCFHVFAIVNSATMDTEVHVSFLIRAFVFSGYMPRSGIAGSYGNSVFSFFYGGGGALVTKSCPTLTTLWTITHQAPPVHRIFQARILEWVAISFSRGSSGPRNRTRVSCIAGRFLHCRQILYWLSYKRSPTPYYSL